MKELRKNRLIEAFLKYTGIKKPEWEEIEKSEKEKPATLRQQTVYFLKDMGFTFGMAVIVIIFVIQAFKIPTGSMENSLYVGDFLLGLKFVYGSPVPFSGKMNKLPGLRDPEPGDVVIFKYPGDPEYPFHQNERYTKILNTFIFGSILYDKYNSGKKLRLYRPKDYIKRCVAKSGQTVEIKNKKLLVNGEPFPDPPKSKYVYGENIVTHPEIDNFSALKIPSPGDSYHLDTLSPRMFEFLKYLIYQENPEADISCAYRIYKDSVKINEVDVKIPNMDYEEQILGAPIYKRPDNDQIKITAALKMNGKPLEKYTVREPCYFMMGDNRDESKDSRYWGFVSRRFIKAKAFIIYFSWNSYKYCSSCDSYHSKAGHNYDLNDPGRCRDCGDFLQPGVPFYRKIRWNRFGKLIK
ncbi:MAG: signal peptidase I [Fibrobacterota bacterium]